MTGASEVEDVGLVERIRDCLNGIVDPCSITAGAPAGLVDMGLVSSLRLEPGPGNGVKAVIEIGITHPFCMMAGVFLNEVQKRVGALEPVEEVAVTLDSDTVWTPALMSEAYKTRLAAVRADRPVRQPENGPASGAARMRPLNISRRTG